MCFLANEEKQCYMDSMKDIETIIEHVAEANPDRNLANLNRRVIKLFEELGELSEAYLASTSSHSYKERTWNDVREEAADVLIVAIDIALTALHEGDDSQTNLVNQCKKALPFDGTYDYVFLALARA